ncbi:hypothetical protein VNI00_005417 [Paramarasmius palmivorus]|uniref:Uncharacterized protein n=1 Tax=Paramarasmius palmivorus TaxID=297713 RepID=A0AAW0B347_9AGAR
MTDSSEVAARHTPLVAINMISVFSPSLESSNNFINFCATFILPLTNGKQITTGSCNPAPMGSIPSIDHIPSVKFQSPMNGAYLKANTAFVVSLAINNLESGCFANNASNYLSAPQGLSGQGKIFGHGSFVIEQMDSLDDTNPLNPNKFTLYERMGGVAVNATLSARVSEGLPEGFYRMSSITRTVNYHPVVVPTLRYAAIDDVVYFTVTSNGQPPGSASLGSSVSRPSAVDRKASINITNLDANPSDQDSRTLISSVIADGFGSNGQDAPQPGQVASLTSNNNYINFCLGGLDTSPITNGRQSNGGSCSPTPIGMIPPIEMIPSHKFQAPKNGDTIPANTPFLIKLNRRNMNQSLTDMDTRYLSAPQQIDSTGAILGYSRIVIDALIAINQINLTDPQRIAVSAPLTELDENGALVTNITNGLPDGFYRLSSVALTANHYPVILPVLQHGAVNDAVYFTVSNGGAVMPTTESGPRTSNIEPTSGPRRPSNIPSSTKIGAIVGGTIGGVAFVAVLVIALTFFLRHRRKRKATEALTATAYPAHAYYVEVQPPYMLPPPPLQPGEIRPYYIGPGGRASNVMANTTNSEKTSEKQTRSASQPSGSTVWSSPSEARPVNAEVPLITDSHRDTIMSSAPSYHTVENA